MNDCVGYAWHSSCNLAASSWLHSRISNSAGGGARWTLFSNYPHCHGLSELSKFSKIIQIVLLCLELSTLSWIIQVLRYYPNCLGFSEVILIIRILRHCHPSPGLSNFVSHFPLCRSLSVIFHFVGHFPTLSDIFQLFLVFPSKSGHFPVIFRSFNKKAVIFRSFSGHLTKKRSFSGHWTVILPRSSHFPTLCNFVRHCSTCPTLSELSMLFHISLSFWHYQLCLRLSILSILVWSCPFLSKKKTACPPPSMISLGFWQLKT